MAKGRWMRADKGGVGRGRFARVENDSARRRHISFCREGGSRAECWKSACSVRQRGLETGSSEHRASPRPSFGLNGIVVAHFPDAIFTIRLCKTEMLQF
jgi:hypothetical protein